MNIRMIETSLAPGAIGPYSQGHIVNGLIYTSGQIPVNPANGMIKKRLKSKQNRGCLNVKAILEGSWQ